MGNGPVYEPPELAGTTLTYRDDEVTGHGQGADLAYVYPGRRVVEVPGRAWPAARPEDCSDTGPGEWLAGRVLVCRGCGLDVT